MKFTRIAAALSAVLVSCAIAYAANTVFFTNLGDQVFPFKAPNLRTGAAGNIDNMIIGATTPRAGTFSVLTNRGIGVVNQGAPAAKTVSATLTAVEIQTGIITVNQGGAAPSALQLPLATAMDTLFVGSIAGDSFDFSLINISVTAAESASITTNTGWTLVGDTDVAANSAATTKSAGRFRARKTATGAWSLYRLS